MRDAQDYLAQVCALAAPPLRTLSAARGAGTSSLDRFKALLEAAAPDRFEVFSTNDATAELYLSACALPRYTVNPNSNINPDPDPDPDPDPLPLTLPLTCPAACGSLRPHHALVRRAAASAALIRFKESRPQARANGPVRSSSKVSSKDVEQQGARARAKYM